jgi:hypothetical protein
MTDTEGFYRDLATFSTASGGVARMHLVACDNLSFLTAVYEGNELAIVLSRAINMALAEIKQRKPGVLCLTCEHRFSNRDLPVAFLLFTAGALTPPEHAIASGICLSCYCNKTKDKLLEQAMQYARKMWPNVFVTTLADEGQA